MERYEKIEKQDGAYERATLPSLRNVLRATMPPISFSSGATIDLPTTNRPFGAVYSGATLRPNFQSRVSA